MNKQQVGLQGARGFRENIPVGWAGWDVRYLDKAGITGASYVTLRRGQFLLEHGYLMQHSQYLEMSDSCN